MIHLIISQNLEYLLESELASVIQIFAEQINPGIGGDTYKYGTAFLTGAIAHTVIYWFKDPQPIPSEQLAGLLTDILSGNYYVIPGMTDCRALQENSIHETVKGARP